MSNIIFENERGLSRTWGAVGYRVSHIDQLSNREAAIAYGKKLLGE